MRRPSEGLFLILVLVAAGAYLSGFVSRGWVPHDEGMIGQTAERVLAGQLPHVDYHEPYTGFLSLIYAGVFAAAGVDLVAIRWVLYALALIATAIFYTLARRFGSPLMAACAACIAVVWSFPNYFAGIPSWWLLACSLAALWSLFRHIETGHAWYAALAGVAAGTAVLVKQTGLYLVMAVVMSVVYRWCGQCTHSSASGRAVSAIRAAVGTAVSAAVVALLRGRLLGSEFVYLFLPVLAAAIPLFLPSQPCTDDSRSSRIAAAAAVVVGSAGPIIVFVAAYGWAGYAADLLAGTLLAPRERLVSAAMPMPTIALLPLGVLLPATLLFANVSAPRRVRVCVAVAQWVVGAAVVMTSLWNGLAYQLIWQGARVVAVLSPVIALVALRDKQMPRHRREATFASVSMMACASLVQYPFAAPIYFCYITPLATLVVMALMSHRVWAHLPRGPIAWDPLESTCRHASLSIL